MSARLRKAVFPVAGLGTRLLPATRAVPKELLPVVDRPAIQYGVDEAAAAGIEEFIFVTSPEKGAIRDHFTPAPALEAELETKGRTEELERLRACIPAGARFAWTFQEQALGLGHAVGCARDLVGDEPFAVILPDDLVLSRTPCLAQMVAAREERGGGSLVAVMDVPREQTSRYGILDTGADDGRLAEIVGLVEKPAPEDAPSTLSIIGRYILDPAIFGHLSAGRPGAGGEIQLTDAMAAMIGTMPFNGLRFEGTRFDCGNPLGLMEANIAFALSRQEFVDGMRDILRRHEIGGN